MLSSRISVPSVLVNSLCQKKVFIMHSQLVVRNCSKHLPFLLMPESPYLPITPFHVTSSVPTCALKSLRWTINSANVTFYKAAPTSFKKSGYCAFALGVYACKMHSDCSCSLNLRRQTLPPSGIQSVAQWAK